MNRILLSTGMTAIALIAADQFHELTSRMSELERAPGVEPEFVRELSREISSLRRDLSKAKDTRDSEESFERIEGKLAIVEAGLARERTRFELQEAELDEWQTRWGSHAPEAIDGKIQELTSDLARRRQELEELRSFNDRVAQQGLERFDELQSKVQPLLENRDPSRMWHELVGPVVQLAGDSTVGSGVLLESHRRTEGEGWVTYLLTSWHVVRDIYGSVDRVTEPVPVRMYEADGAVRDERAKMVVYDVPLDLALLEMELDEPVPHGARLAPRDKLGKLQIFDSIYAVGCPLGNDPIPTVGEIAATNHRVDGQSYWMISAPTYIGNSGGGIFDARTHELVGIFSKIYTHGASRSTIVPHMGLATPLPIVYDWLDRSGYTALVDSPSGNPTQTASAGR
jgi:S1-C subfamily serine protease